MLKYLKMCTSFSSSIRVEGKSDRALQRKGKNILARYGQEGGEEGGGQKMKRYRAKKDIAAHASLICILQPWVGMIPYLSPFFAIKKIVHYICFVGRLKKHVFINSTLCSNSFACWKYRSCLVFSPTPFITQSSMLNSASQNRTPSINKPTAKVKFMINLGWIHHKYNVKFVKKLPQFFIAQSQLLTLH